MKRILHWLVLQALILYGVTSYSQSVKCFLYKIGNLDKEHDLGVKFNGVDTRNLSEAKVYITASDDKLYMQSNFLVYEDSEYPVKMLVDRKDIDPIRPVKEIDTESFLAGLVLREEDQLKGFANGTVDYSDVLHNIDLTIDPSVLKSESFSHLDFSEFKNIKFACPDDVARAGSKLRYSNGSFEYIIKYSDNISIRINRNNLAFTFSRLDAPSNFENMHIISLIENSSTKELLKQKFSGQATQFDYSGVQDFKDLLLRSKEQKTVLIGHIEENSFITYNAGGEEIFRIPISEIQSYQKAHDLNLIILGCNAAEEGVAGPISKFNSIDIINRLERAKNSSSYQEFVDRLSDGELHFVLDETFFADEVEMQALKNGERNLPSRLDFEVLGKNANGRVTILSSFRTDEVITSENGSEGEKEDEGGKESNTWKYILGGIAILVFLGYVGKSS